VVATRVLPRIAKQPNAVNCKCGFTAICSSDYTTKETCDDLSQHRCMSRSSRDSRLTATRLRTVGNSPEVLLCPKKSSFHPSLRGSLRLGWKELFFGQSNTSGEFSTVRSRVAVSLSRGCSETCNGVDLGRHTFWPAAAAVMRTVSLSMTHSGMQLM